MRRLGAVLLGLLFLSFACAGQNEDLQNAVRNYNMLLAQGYRTMDMTPLAAAATPDRVMKAYHHMAALGEGGMKMDASIDDIRFDTLKLLTSTEAEVVTKESWHYRYVALEHDKPGKESAVRYTVLYRLIHAGEKWLVADLQILSSDKADDGDLLPFWRRPAGVSQGGRDGEPR